MFDLMPAEVTLRDLVLRLGLTFVAGMVIGFNRGQEGHEAGLRTTILVGLAAAVAMIQANLLLPLDGKTPGSFGVMDLMRLPLGILTGVGFIGGGAILKRGDAVTGVTTAATLWVMTTIGLCFGGGQFMLGSIATCLAVVTIWLLKWLESAVPREHRAMLVISARSDQPVPDLAKVIGGRYRGRFLRESRKNDSATFEYEVEWQQLPQDGAPVELLDRLRETYAIEVFDMTARPSRV